VFSGGRQAPYHDVSARGQPLLVGQPLLQLHRAGPPKRSAAPQHRKYLVFAKIGVCRNIREIPHLPV
jgi:hypothetical protein